MPDPSQLKKRLCNPPAENVAAAGDPELCGLFVGAGRGVEIVEDAVLRKQFVEAVVAVEASYIDGRRKLAEECVKEMHDLFDKLLANVGAHT